jgi:toxin-antitoxin system PIN domain toxin
MLAVDTNVLVYAHRGDSAWHAPADLVMQELAEGRESWAIAWPCLYEFFAVVTHPRIYQPPAPPGHALEQIAAWLESPTLVLLHEDEGFFDGLRQLLGRAAVQGGAVHDARVAALCLRHGVTARLTADRDSSRVPELKVRNPLV